MDLNKAICWVLDNAEGEVTRTASLIQRSFLRPQHLRETVLHKRVSGFKDPSFVALANSMQPFSCYRDHLELLGKDFLNPISKGSTQRYFFQLEDTLYRGPDTIYTIAFQPRVGSKFTGLKGWLNIHTRGYAIQSISAEPAIRSRSEDRSARKRSTSSTNARAAAIKPASVVGASSGKPSVRRIEPETRAA